MILSNKRIEDQQTCPHHHILLCQRFPPPPNHRKHPSTQSHLMENPKIFLLLANSKEKSKKLCAKFHQNIVLSRMRIKNFISVVQLNKFWCITKIYITCLLNHRSCKCPDIYRPNQTPSVEGACECVCKYTSGLCRRLMKGKRFFRPKDFR